MSRSESGLYRYKKDGYIYIRTVGKWNLYISNKNTIKLRKEMGNVSKRQQPKFNPKW